MRAWRKHMLTHADAAIVSRDPVLPGLPTLLDSDACADLLRRQYPGAGVQSVRPSYMRYKPGRSCIAGFEVGSLAGNTLVYLRAVSAHRWKELAGAERFVVPGILGDGVSLVPELCLDVNLFPNDAELTTVARLGSPELRREVLSRFARGDAELLDAEPRIVRYKPERRLVLHVGGEKGVLVKCYTKEAFTRAAVNAAAFHRTPSLHLARLRGAGVSRATLAWEWIPGSTMQDSLIEREDHRLVDGIVAALVSLHEQQAGLSARYNPCMVASEAAVVGTDLALLLPALASRLQTLMAQLAARCAAIDPISRSLHGDLSADQIILGPGQRVTLLDFDRAGAGHPAYDFATFAVRHWLSGGDYESEVIARLLDSYERATGVAVKVAMPAFLSAAMLLLATEPFRRRSSDWSERTEQLIMQAQAVLNHELSTP
jgi:thiamine kinase-like enzyme